MTGSWKRRAAAGVAALGLGATLVLPGTTPVAHMQGNTVVVISTNETDQEVTGAESSPCSRGARCETPAITSASPEANPQTVVGTGDNTLTATNSGNTVTSGVRGRARARNTKAVNRTELRVKRVVTRTGAP